MVAARSLTRFSRDPTRPWAGDLRDMGLATKHPHLIMKGYRGWRPIAFHDLGG
jgi:hypothetical protein